MASPSRPPPLIRASLTTTEGRGPRTGKRISKSVGIGRSATLFPRTYSTFSNRRIADKEHTMKQQPASKMAIVALATIVALGTMTILGQLPIPVPGQPVQQGQGGQGG